MRRMRTSQARDILPPGALLFRVPLLDLLIRKNQDGVSGRAFCALVQGGKGGFRRPSPHWLPAALTPPSAAQRLSPKLRSHVEWCRWQQMGGKMHIPCYLWINRPRLGQLWPKSPRCLHTQPISNLTCSSWIIKNLYWFCYWGTWHKYFICQLSEEDDINCIWSKSCGAKAMVG